MAANDQSQALSGPAPSCAGLTFPGGGTLEVYQPGDPTTNPPEPAAGRFPVVVFHKGNDLSAAEYGELIQTLQQSGFVVLNVNTGQVFSAAEATEAMLCALRWFYFDSGLFGGASCDVVLAGHSRGGLAAQRMLGAIRDDEFLAQVTPSAQVLLANSGSSGTDEITPYGPAEAVPFLVLGTSTDEDVPGRALRAYDNMAVESEYSLPDAEPTPYRGAFWVYDLPHTGFGGRSPVDVGADMSARSGLTAPDYDLTGSTITRAYVDRFLRWQVHGDASLRPYFVGEAYPEEILNPDWWDYLTAYDELSDPVVCAAALDFTTCQASGCAWDGTVCRQQPVVLSSFTIDNRPEDATRELADLFEFSDASAVDTPGGVLSVAIDEAVLVTQGMNVNLSNHHATRVAFVQTNTSAAEGAVRFPVDADATNATHASFRIGTRSRIDSNVGSTPPLCESVNTDALDVRMRVGSGLDTSGDVDLRPIPQQDAVAVQQLGMSPVCLPSLFMHTQRIPMADICATGFMDTSNITEWSFIVPNAQEQIDEFVVDTLEFTAAPEDVSEVGTCPTTTALWNCVAATGLVPQRTVCTGEPDNGVCPLGSQQLEYPALPTVDSTWGGPFTGWVVNMPPGYSDDPFNPTPELQAAMEQRCELACEREWMSSPDVTVDCTAATAFSSVTPASSPSQGTLWRIRPDRRDGSGFFAGQSLSCNLEDDCCPEPQRGGTVRLKTASPRASAPHSRPYSVSPILT